MIEEDTNPDVLQIQDACERLGISAEELRDLVTTDKLVPISYEENGSPLFSVTSIESLHLEEETFLPKESELSADTAEEIEEEEDFNPNQPTKPIEIVRDRIVILGRRRAGKTVFLSRLYELCWNATDNQNLHMECDEGNSHKTFRMANKLMMDGEWPAATLGETYSRIKITRNRQEHNAIVLDYPGEVFRRAFVDGLQDGSARELLAHVDRAAGAILLIDPDVALSGNLDEFIDDDYGLVKAIRRIRETPGGEMTPIAIVLTKCDQNKQKVKEWGKRTGVRTRTGLLNELYANLMRVLREHGRVKTFGCAAVLTKRCSDGKIIPLLSERPKNVVEPIAWCIDEIQKVEEEKRKIQEVKDLDDARVAHLRLVKEKSDRNHFLKTTKYSLLAAFLTIAFFVLIVLLLKGI